MRKAAAVVCPSCGAASPAPMGAAPVPCAYCKAVLHPLRCPWCFAWSFAESRECGGCGSTPPEGPAPALSCPSCRGELARRERGGATLAGCAGCGGVWLDPASLRRVCEDKAAQTAYLGDGALAAKPRTSDPSGAKVMYRPCAECGEMMNRVNFAGSSGVVLDACRPHGAWFDADELAKIVAFIRSGGLDEARRRDLARLEAENRRLRALKESSPFSDEPPRVEFDEAALRAAVAAGRGLLRAIFG